MQSRRNPRVTLNFNQPLYRELMEQAEENDRSLNREVLRRLQASLQQEQQAATA
jgi:hypothetical protein